ncbi:hypothetical protein AAGS40_23405 [Paraburkholderia sp. PREW-6R]|uniref:transcriptional regulator n=1 Tax=Paraburkholderia sp. PREW-6R TaxID=3141544 RepID=UPI0031F4E4D4
MEKLKEFFSSLSIPERKQFASRCGTSVAFIRNVMYGQRVPGEKLCVKIERETDCRVLRQDLRADWEEIWPELRTDGPIIVDGVIDDIEQFHVTETPGSVIVRMSASGRPVYLKMTEEAAVWFAHTVVLSPNYKSVAERLPFV